MRILISHTSDQTPFAHAVAEELRRRGLDPGSDVDAASRVNEWIEGLRSSEVFVVFIGDSVNSPSLNFEIGAAVGGAKHVVPVYLTESARRDAPGVVSQLAGIDAHDLKPDQVAQRIEAAVAGTPADA